MERTLKLIWRGALLTCFATAPVVMSGGHVRAEDDVKRVEERGHALAQTLCQSCHLVDGQSAATVPAGIPTFRAIANKSGQTGQRIKDVLIQPHPPMPAIQLSNDEITSIVTYLETLRTNTAVPPLIIPRGEKPKFPAPT